MLWGFYNSVELTSVPWRRGSFLVGKILINMRILQDPFLIGILLIRVNSEVQDVSLYTHSWRESKATLDSSKASFFLSASLLSHTDVVRYWDGVVSLWYSCSRFSECTTKADGFIGTIGYLIHGWVYPSSKITLSWIKEFIVWVVNLWCVCLICENLFLIWGLISSFCVFSFLRGWLGFCK